MTFPRHLSIDPRLLTALLSLLASLWVTSTSQLTNTDGVLYLRTAEAFMADGFSAAQLLFDNPYYSVLIGLFAQTLNIETINAAHIINIAACSLIGWIVADLGMKIGGGVNSGYCAGALLLLHPQFNEYRGYIIRDFIFWACLLSYLDLQLRFYLTLKHRFLYLGLIVLLIGALFRVESLLFVALPLLALYPLKKHISIIRLTLKAYLRLFLFAGLTIAMLSTGLLVNTDYIIKPVLRFVEIGGLFQQAVLDHESAFKQYLLHGYLEDYALAGVIAAFIIIVILKALKSFTLPYLIITTLLSKSIANLRLSNVRTAVIYTFFVYYCIILISYTLNTTVIQGRHVLPLTLAIIPLLGCFLEHWLTLQQAGARKRTRQMVLTGGFAIYLLVDSFVSFGAPKTHLNDTINWLQVNAANCTLHTNETKIAYFSRLKINWKEIQKFSSVDRKYQPEHDLSEVLAIEYHKKDPYYIKLLSKLDQERTEQIRFESKKRGVVIYSRTPELPCGKPRP